jgi:hypothetical protein
MKHMCKPLFILFIALTILYILFTIYKKNTLIEGNSLGGRSGSGGYGRRPFPPSSSSGGGHHFIG